MGKVTSLRQRSTLTDAKAMLLIRDDQARRGKFHPVAEQRLGTDHHVKTSGGIRVSQRRLDLLLLRGRRRTDQQGTANAQLGKQLTYSAVYDKLKKVQAEVGLNFNFHDLRHTFCSNLIESGMDISIVKIIMGHEHISTTQKYTHLSHSYIEDRLSRYWSRSIMAGGDTDDK